VLFQGEEFFVVGHEEIGLARFNQREQIAVLGVRRDRAGGQVPTKKGEVPKARGEQLGRAGAKSRPEKRPGGDIADFRYVFRERNLPLGGEMPNERCHPGRILEASLACFIASRV